MPKDSERWNKRNKRLRAENDYNLVLKEYLTVKYGPIVSEFSVFYDSLREKYPDNHSYKGSKKFRTWVRNQIVQYDAKNTEENDTVPPNQSVQYNAENTEENNATTPVAGPPNQIVQYNAENTEENNATTPVAGPNAENTEENNAVTLGGLVVDLVAAPPVVQQPLQNRNPLENIIANGQQAALEELDVLIGDIIRDIENQCDEGIDLSPSHEVVVESMCYDVEPMYYDVEIEGLDDIVLDIEADPRELELENIV